VKGNRHKLPKPTAEPMAASIKAVFDDQLTAGVCVLGIGFFPDLRRIYLGS